MHYPDLNPDSLRPPAGLCSLRRLTGRLLFYASAGLIAVVVSGGIFSFTPLIGLSLAHTTGRSMEPAHKDGDVVLVQKVDAANVRVGDVIVFQDGQRKVMHRVTERNLSSTGELVFTTQGDNVPVPDRPVPAHQVTARLVGEVPLLGAVSRLLDADGGFYVYRSLVITTAVGFVALWGLASAARGEAARSKGLDV